MSFIKHPLKYVKNHIWIVIPIFLIFSLVYYFIIGQKRSDTVYLVIYSPNIPYYSASSLIRGDKESNPFSTEYASIENIEQYDMGYSTKFVSLLLKANLFRDKTGVYLYKNKPVSVGNDVEFQFTRTLFKGTVTYLDKIKPVNKYRKINVVLIGRATDLWRIDAVPSEGKIFDNDSNLIAEIKNKRIEPTYININTQAGTSVQGIDKSKKDIYLTVEITVSEVNGEYYFIKTQRVKTDQTLYLPFPEYNIKLPILSVSQPT